jgi:Bacterial Ig domain
MSHVFSNLFIHKILAGFGVWCCLFFLPIVVQSTTSDSSTLQWEANPESDLAGYRIYHGTTPGVYGYPQSVGKITTYQYTNLESNKTHYYTLTAYDTSGNESLPSPEVSKYIAVSSVSDPTPSSSSSLTLSNLTVASGQPYVVPASGLQVGDMVYIDRSFTYTSVPASVQGAAYIQTANNDKAATTSAFLSFNVNEPVTVYVAHDVRITSKPLWLTTFTDTGKDLVTSDTTLHLFSQSFPAGTITLGGNASGGGFSMYSVIVQPQDGNIPPPDTTPPTVALVAPGNGTSLSGTRTVSATATDNIGVVGVQFQLNGTNLGAEDTTNSFALSWNTSGVTPGPYTLTAIARDAAGNTTTSPPIIVTVLDITPPSIAFASPTNGSTFSGTVNINATATDNIGVVGVQFRLNGKTLGAEDTTAPFSLSWDTTTVSNGSYTLSSTARDAAGNTTTTSPITVTVSNTSSPPSSSLTVSNLAVASGRNYVVPASGLQAGAPVYIDRSYTVTTVPTSLQGATYIQTANADKAATNTTFLRFVVNQPVTVYVAHDVRITSKPSWLTTFTNTGQNLVTSDATLRLFARSFPAGTITLGGNASGGGSSMYAVIIQP